MLYLFTILILNEILIHLFMYVLTNNVYDYYAYRDRWFSQGCEGRVTSKTGALYKIVNTHNLLQTKFFFIYFIYKSIATCVRKIITWERLRRFDWYLHSISSQLSGEKVFINEKNRKFGWYFSKCLLSENSINTIKITLLGKISLRSYRKKFFFSLHK